jgi:S-methylmethionine-dependent homocysteine/selenocysteine methylase
MDELQERLKRGEVVILDGAIGSELQAMGVPMDDAAWCAVALKTHPETVRQLHEDYIRAGADVITTNTYSSARHNLEEAGLTGLTRELNLRAIQLAREARDRASGGRPVSIAGALSNFGAFSGTVGRKPPAAEHLRAAYREQAELLAEGGADLLALEMVRDLEHGEDLIRAALATGLPVWVGFSCRIDEKGDVKLLGGDPEARRRRASIEGDVTLRQGIDGLMRLGGHALTIMHSEVEDTAPALRVALDRWSGPIGAYPHSGYWKRPDWQFVNVVPPEDYLTQAREWVRMGVQIIGGCCGIGRAHIRRLREGLPARTSRAAS